MFMGNGPEAFKQTRTMMYSGFPDLHWTIEEMVAEGEKVAERVTARGTHEGDVMGVPPSGKRVEFPGQAIFHFAEGKIVEVRGMPDMLGLMKQIGAVPSRRRPKPNEPVTYPSRGRRAGMSLTRLFLCLEFPRRLPF